MILRGADKTAESQGNNRIEKEVSEHWLQVLITIKERHIVGPDLNIQQALALFASLNNLTLLSKL